MRAFETALGADKTFFEDLDRTSLSGQVLDRPGAPPARVGAIAPTSVEEVQAALKVANQYRLPRLADQPRQEPGLWRHRPGCFRAPW